MDSERRRADDKQWDKINEFIDTSREYRAELSVTLDYMRKAHEDLVMQIKIQNGRVTKSEKAIHDLEVTDKGRKDIEKVVGTVGVAGACAVAGAVMVWVGRAMINQFKNGG